MSNRIVTAAVTALVAGALVAVPALPAAAAPGDYDWFFAGVTTIDDVVSIQDVGSLEGVSDFPLVCDATASGDSPALWNEGTWSLDGVAPFGFGRTSDSDYPLCGDWDGDGQDTVGVVRGNRYFLASANVPGGGTVTAFSFGRAEDFPIVGDWNGDGTDTIALRRGKDYFFASANVAGGGAVVRSSFGREDDFPVAGDWDGNGTETLALRRDKFFFFTNQAAGTPALRAPLARSVGRASDYPVAGRLAGETASRLGLVRIGE